MAHNSGGPVYPSSLRNSLHVFAREALISLKREKELTWSGKHFANLDTVQLSGSKLWMPAARISVMAKARSVHMGV